MDRRAELAEKALDHVLQHGLLALSLRPLAAALGTSDRMLIYHFGSKEGLVADVLSCAQGRLAADLDLTPAPADLRGLLLGIWQRLITPNASGVTTLYLEVCVLAGHEPHRWAAAARRLREPWRQPMLQALVDYGAGPKQASVLTDLILATYDGLALDRLTTERPGQVDHAAAHFADLIAASVHLS